MTTSTTNDSKWGTDDQSNTNYGTTALWLNIDNSSPYTVVQRTTETTNCRR